ncbi:MAG: hypothetical protein IJ822_04325 [Pyramidobacter sp.]|nr:hypothetical protein [Pyramidobacter sp.]MBQ8129434.1 hypothetical protein [Clostridia bacterium]MBR1895986.1 hypothetical protein [Pyramidobacter sp.]
MKTVTRYYAEYRGGRRLNRFEAWAEDFFSCRDAGVPWWRRLLAWLTE